MGELSLALLVTLLGYYVTGGDTRIMIPFVNTTVDFGLFWFPFNIFIMISITNAVNLTDGLDGLASGVSLVVGVFFAFFAARLGLLGVSDFSGAVVGACLGFLIFNYYPAKVFMGDTGSLALGGAFGIISVLSGTQLFLPFVGIIYVVETLSVMIQVGYFKLTGKRFFKMAPLHHHFEILGYEEKKIFRLFTLITIVACVIMFLF